MRKLLSVVLVLIVAVGALGYWRGWFGLTKENKVEVQVDPAKFKQDKEAFSKTVGQKAKATKDQIARLWKKAEGLSADEGARAQEQLRELEKKHDRLTEQIKELDDAGQGRFESIRQDLSKTLEEVEKKIEELTKKLENGNDK
jgi:TolA-binding protein